MVYFRFQEASCTFSQLDGNSFAKDVFDNSGISKSNGIYVLIIKNWTTSSQYEWRTYFAFGTSVSNDIKVAAENFLTINTTAKASAYSGSLINFYTSVPKKQKEYVYIIEKATAQEVADAGTHNIVTKNILSKVVENNNAEGNAIQATYYIQNTSGNLLEKLEAGVYHELKEEYVVDPQKVQFKFSGIKVL